MKIRERRDLRLPVTEAGGWSHDASENNPLVRLCLSISAEQKAYVDLLAESELHRLNRDRVKRSTSCRNTAVPPTIRHSACNSLRMQASLFMTLWKVLSVPPDSTTSAFNSLRMQTSQFTILPGEKSANCIPQANKHKQVTVR